MKRALLLPVLLISTLVLLSACGFTPMRAQNTASGKLLSNITLDVVEGSPVEGSEGAYWVRQALYDRLGNDHGAYRLKVTSKFRRSGIGITAADIQSRYDLNGALTYELIDAVTGKVLTTGRVSGTSTFGSNRDSYALSTSEKTAYKNLSATLADLLISRVAAYQPVAGK